MSLSRSLHAFGIVRPGSVAFGNDRTSSAVRPFAGLGVAWKTSRYTRNAGYSKQYNFSKLAYWCVLFSLFFFSVIRNPISLTGRSHFMFYWDLQRFSWLLVWNLIFFKFCILLSGVILLYLSVIGIVGVMSVVVVLVPGYTLVIVSLLSPKSQINLQVTWSVVIECVSMFMSMTVYVINYSFICWLLSPWRRFLGWVCLTTFIL